MNRKTALATLAALAVTPTLPARAQGSASDWPTKPVTLVTAFAPGSGPDATLRVLAEKLGKLWNKPVNVDNRPGGGGFIALDAARRAAPDGHTLLQLDSDHLSALPHLYPKRGPEALRQYEPVTGLFRTTFLVAVGKDSPYKSLGDIISAAKANPGQLSYGSWGVGSPGHLGGELLELLSGLKMQHVPYKDVSTLFSNVATGEVNWSLGTLPSSSGAYQAGKLRYLAVASPRRLPQLPAVPTAREAGGPDLFDVNAFVVLMSPKGIPAALRSRIQADVAKVLTDPEVRARFDSFAFEPLPWGPEEIGREAAAKSKVTEQLVKKAGISLE